MNTPAPEVEEKVQWAVMWLAFVVVPSFLGLIFSAILAIVSGTDPAPLLTDGDVLLVVTALNASALPAYLFQQEIRLIKTIVLCLHFILIVFSALFYAVTAFTPVGTASQTAIMWISICMVAATVTLCGISAVWAESSRKTVQREE